MNQITNLDEYLEVERQADELYEKPHKQAELDNLIYMMAKYEEAHPEEISKIYGDETNLSDPDDTLEDYIQPTYNEEDYW